ncbi:O-antigen polymerase [Arthrobacter sp. NPDC093139]|uniref:O-antigen polymerase n=1 Tax=Arthrobacter sp. NPDC093139 TaxID=3363945 RepID=UPI0037FF458B
MAWLVGTKFRRGSLLSPYSLVLLILLSIYGVRPLLMPGEPRSFMFYGYSITSGFEQAALLGFLGIMAFILGYVAVKLGLTSKNSAPMMTTIVNKTESRLHDSAPSRAAAAAWTLFAAWFAAMVALGGGIGFLAVLFAGRSEQSLDALAGVPAFIFALPVIGCLLIAAVRLQHERATPYIKSQNIGYWLVAAASVVPPSALGTRRFLIPSLVIVLLGALANDWQRKIKLKWIVAGLGVFLALAAIPFVRSAGSRTSGSTDLLGSMAAYFREEGVRGALNNFFLSWDTEMFNYVAYLSQRMGDEISFGLGRGTVGELLAMPIPAAISPFPRWNDMLLKYAFGSECSIETACPVPSIVGVLYSDLATPGLLLGMVLIGGMSARFEERLVAATGTRVGVLLLAAGFSVLVARGNSMAQVWLAVQCFVVWWLIHRIFLAAPSQESEAKRALRQLPHAYRQQAAEVTPEPAPHPVR